MKFTDIKEGEVYAVARWGIAKRQSGMTKGLIVSKEKGSNGRMARITVRLLSQNRGYIEQPDDPSPEARVLKSGAILQPWHEYAAWCKEQQEIIDNRNKKELDKKTALHTVVNGIRKLAGLPEISIKDLYYQTDSYSFTVSQMQAILDAFAKQQQELEGMRVLDNLDIF